MDKQTLTVDNIPQTRARLIGHWFYNFRENIFNNEILYVDFLRRNLVIYFKESILKFHRNDFDFENEATRKKYFDKHFLNRANLKNKEDLGKTLNKNIISLPFLGLSFEHFRDINKPVLFLVANFVKYEHEIESIFKSIFENIEEYQEAPYIPKEMRYYFYIESVNPIELIKSENPKALREFLMFKLFNYEFDIAYIKQPIKAIIANTNFDGYYHNDNVELLRELICRDLSLFEDEKILTARLGVVLYKVATLNNAKSITAIGKYYHEELKVCSKNFYGVYQRFSDDFKEYKGIFKDFKKKSFKAYELGKASLSEYDTRIDIAKSLIQNTSLDTNTIVQVTQLTEDTVEKLRI